MYQFKVNKNRNALMCILIGKFSSDEATEYNLKYAECVNTLQSNFVLLSDITQYVPTDDVVREIFRKGTEYAVSKGLRRVVQIVADNQESTSGNQQWNKAAKEMGYTVDIVNSMQEAETLLGWQSSDSTILLLNNIFETFKNSGIA